MKVTECLAKISDKELYLIELSHKIEFFFEKVGNDALNLYKGLRKVWGKHHVSRHKKRNKGESMFAGITNEVIP